MDYFSYRDNRLFAEDVAIEDIVKTHGSPCYIYSRATFERHWKAFDDALSGHDHLVCFAVKANSNLGVLNVLAQMGSGFDIVSGGELERVLAAGGEANKIVFSGVGKTATEMRRALEVGIRCFNVESEAELVLLNDVAGEMGIKAPVSIRVNPNVDARTHPYISTGLKENKFGIDISIAPEVYGRASKMENISIEGVDCHIGSQLTDTRPFIDALDLVLNLIDLLDGMNITIHHLDLGGGLGIQYRDETPPLPAEYARALSEKLQGRDLQILIEPGRAIAGNAGILITQVEFIKSNDEKHFAIVDAAMNDLMRPALYSAWQNIIPVTVKEGQSQIYDIVGPICETGDFLGKDRELILDAGDLLAVRSSGAYGFSMSSNYNSRPRVAEIMVDGDKVHVVRERETIESLYANEHVLP
ncbi:MAG: diaminopimelate decarboxylase [Gammaproteobacteria bacterium]|nr:diaminopimelate decarboxylase [Gammaproteobacteria bacterium]MCW8986850.1 diaminopimelate decarboxylase [Gammaproteobacteria bacterium]MCW9031151.1 diaminopimelate decarboxylase [Gammaproteobacteria bacterium]